MRLSANWSRSYHLEGVVALMRRAFAIFWKSLGLDHPNTQTLGGNYTALLLEMGLADPEIQAKLQALLPPT